MSTETAEKEVQAPEFSFNSKTEVMISNTTYDKFNKKKLSDLVNKSGIHQEHKMAIWSQINKGQIEPKYHATVKSIIQAAAGGSVFHPGTNGY